MTNSEKYLKDNIKVNDFANMCVYLTRYFDNKISMQKVADFFNEQAKPTLTEDERVILRNIDKSFIKIGKYDNTLMVFCTDGTHEEVYILKDNLFQFIKERRRIRDSRTFERRIKMVAEFLICVAIAFAIIFGFVLMIIFCVWLDKNKGIDVTISIPIIVTFIILTFLVWIARSGVRESKETKLERRRI